MSSFGAVLDANVLYPASLRDILLYTAAAGLYRPHFTDNILEEMRRNLVRNGKSEESMNRLVAAIRNSFKDAIVTDYQELISAMKNHEKDRYVLAAAVKSGSQVIVTQNLKDFPHHALAPFDIEAQHPDTFLVHLFYLSKETIASVLITHASMLSRPAKTVPEVLANLERHIPEFVRLVRQDLQFADQYSWSLRKHRS